MMIDYVHGFALFLLYLFTLRFLQVHLDPESPWGRTLAFLAR